MNIPAATINGVRHVPPPVNEPVKSYAPGSPEKAEPRGCTTSSARS